MKSRTRVLGPHVNPLVATLPIGLFASVVLFDFSSVASGVGLFAIVARWDLLAGVLTGLGVLVVLFVDVITTPVGTAARRELGFASAATSAMVVLFALVWWIRTDGQPEASAGLLLLEVVALTAGAAGGWFARGLVTAHGAVESIEVRLPSLLS